MISNVQPMLMPFPPGRAAPKLQEYAGPTSDAINLTDVDGTDGCTFDATILAPCLNSERVFGEAARPARLLPAQRLQPVLGHDQLALLGRLALAHHEEVLVVGSEGVGGDRADAGELGDLE